MPGHRDFSFSGLKTSVARYVTLRRSALALPDDAGLPAGDVRDLCASFQRVVVATLLDAVFDAAGRRRRAVGGHRRRRVGQQPSACATRWRAGPRSGLPVLVPP